MLIRCFDVGVEMAMSYVDMRPAGYEEDNELDDLSFVEPAFHPVNNGGDRSAISSVGSISEKRPTRFGRKNLPKLQTSQNGAGDRSKNLTQKVVAPKRLSGLIKSTDDFKMAVMRNDLNTVRECLEQGMLADTIFNTAWTALMYAANFGKPDVVKLLLENGANPNYDKDSLTVLMVACSSSCRDEANVLECVTLLLKHKAEVNAFDRSHMTPLHKAVSKGRLMVVKKLLESGADVDRQDYNGCTALMVAVKQNNIKMIKLLLEAGADGSKQTILGEKALDLANLNGFTEAEKLLSGEGQACITNGEADIMEKRTSSELSCTAEPSLTSQISSNMNSFPQRSSLLRNKQPSLPNQDDSKQVEVYSYGELEVFLMGLDLADLIAKFHYHNVQFTDFLQMSDKDLQQLGITQFVVRKKILDAIQDTHKMSWKTSSINVIPYNKPIKCADAVAMVTNIKKHVSFISSTIGYVADQIKEKPEILAQAEDQCTSEELRIESEEAITNVKYLHEELVVLRNFLTEIAGSPLYQPASLCQLKHVKEEPRTWFSARTVLLGAALCGVLYYNKQELYRRLTLLFDGFTLLSR